jgi:hypothetical protein
VEGKPKKITDLTKKTGIGPYMLQYSAITGGPTPGSCNIKLGDLFTQEKKFLFS